MSPESRLEPSPLRIHSNRVFDTVALTTGELAGRQFVVFERYDLRGPKPGDPGYGVNWRPDAWVWDVHRVFWDKAESIHVADVLRTESSWGLIGLAAQHSEDHSNGWIIFELEEAFANMRGPRPEELSELDYIKILIT